MFSTLCANKIFTIFAIMHFINVIEKQLFGLKFCVANHAFEDLKILLLLWINMKTLELQLKVTLWTASLCNTRSASVRKRSSHWEQMNPPGGSCLCLCFLSPVSYLNVWLQTFKKNEKKFEFHNREIFNISRHNIPSK